MTALRRISPFWIWVAFLLAVIGVGLVAVFLIFTQGLGVTGLSDGVPWGLWITLDLSCIGLAAGAFSISAITYLLGRESYKPLARVAVFIGLLGYSGALMALVLDIGRPDRFWHGWVFWNVHSMLWEVTMCITLYFSVLLLEVFPMAVEMPFLAKYKWLQNFAHRIHHFAPVLAIMGLGLSLLHQSSLGATYGVVIGRAALFRSTMPLLFIVSAVAAGMAFTVHITLIVQWIKRRELVPNAVLFEVGQIAAAVLLLYLYMRFWDTTAGTYGYVPGRTEAENVLTAGPFAVSFWTWEMILGGVVAASLLIRARLRQSVMLLLIGSGLVMAGLIANRWHTTLLAFTQPLAENPAVTDPLITAYTPAWTEWATAAMVVAILTLLFSLGMRYFPAYKGEAVPEAVTAAQPVPIEGTIPETG
ncbi:MAG: polysulfide reductase NrfD [Anaerolineaceae bacterium]|nr:polysulfide reductase NrfD [Anaerolineaceae bacterium]